VTATSITTFTPTFETTFTDCVFINNHNFLAYWTESDNDFPACLIEAFSTADSNTLIYPKLIFTNNYVSNNYIIGPFGGKNL